MAVGAACSRGPRDTDGNVGADVSGRVAIGNEDVEAASSVVAVRCVGEEGIKASILRSLRHGK